MLTNWQHSTVHNCTFDVVETKTLWGDISCCFSIAALDSVVRIPAFNLRPLEDVVDTYTLE